jgi:hypothetical protein
MKDDNYDHQSLYQKYKRDRRKIVNATPEAETTNTTPTTTNTSSKVELRHSKEGIGKLFIQSIGTKKRKGLSDEDRHDLNLFGYSGDGATLVDI